MQGPRSPFHRSEFAPVSSLQSSTSQKTVSGLGHGGPWVSLGLKFEKVLENCPCVTTVLLGHYSYLEIGTLTLVSFTSQVKGFFGNKKKKGKTDGWGHIMLPSETTHLMFRFYEKLSSVSP